MVKNFEELIKVAKEQKKMRLTVAAAQDEEVLVAVCGASQLGIIEPIFIGDKEKINQIAKENDLKMDQYEIIDQKELEDSAKTAVRLVSSGQADFVMKGLLDTSILLKAVLDKEIGLRTDSQLSHVMVYDIPTYHKLLFLTDGGMNIAPVLEEKVKITKNAIQVAKSMGIERVKVAALAAKEKVSSKMQATIDADMLKQMSENGEFGKGVIVDGPLALDLAISKEAAQIKKFDSEVAGDADVLLVPTIEVGNGIGKALTYFANAESAGIIMGAKAPVVLVSRADTHEAKLNSIALGCVIAANK
ncbi:bifunctional enoyl-CoA hydratase/phosphate acetyltransferase [Crassaminicella thermophila]|uniref:Bifunctional enoyl-CoA hydratase/phosphate acetyltransferase n=1 Tax=Crassaminicella thermophila TaxID=2599308 RepID=A0A5C0SE87_CRATE|nr:bifunctional enoyl-CoA hydratase/phosphate acetyltransferase [Crassaminicella thermophila]QEK12470.1 bifunctional enoyl-CoA hydratase/phosphate acetyltransferase [Crassaminicella thermophila]